MRNKTVFGRIDMSVYDDIKKKFVLPDAYDDWKEYRELLTDKVIGLRKGNPEKTVCVIGAGRCNDIDKHKLLDAFANVSLVDYDTDAVGGVFKGLTNKEIWKLYIREMSLTGITEKDISGFCEDTILAMRSCGNALRVDDFYGIVCNGIEKLKSRMIKSGEEILKILPKSDIVLCNGVFSQLFSTISFFIKSCAASMPERLIPEAMTAAAKLEEEITLISRDIVPVITGAIIGSANEYAVFGNEYSEEHPVEGACRCIDAVRNEKVVEESRYIWDFNRKRNIRYEMLIQVVETRKNVDF